MNKTLIALVAVAGFTFSTFSASANAQWKGNAGLGLVTASGNADNSTFSGTAGLSNKAGLWKHNIFADLYKAKSNGVTSADRLMLGYKADRDLTDRIYGWGALRYETDEFANIDRRLVGTVGVGHHTLLGPVHTLDLEAGVGYRKTAFVANLADSSEGIFTLAAIYAGRLTDTVSLTQRLLLELGQDNTLLESVTGVNYRMSSNLSLSLAYVLRRNSDIVGLLGKKSDSLATINMVYSFQ